MYRISFLFLLSLLLLGACSVEQEEHWQQFEQPLLLLWTAIYEEDEPAVANYNERLQDEWKVLNETYGHLASSREWHRYFQSLGLWMEKLDQAARTGDLPEAEIRIYQIQDELSSLRLRFGIDSPTDRLYEFRRRWDTVVQIAYDPKLCLYEWNEYELITAQAEAAWFDWLAIGPGYYPDWFPGVTEQPATIREQTDRVTRQLSDFRLLLREGDQGLVQPPASTLRRAFYDYLNTLTAFPNREPVIG